MPLPVAHAVIGATIAACSHRSIIFSRDWDALSLGALLAISPDFDSAFVWNPRSWRSMASQLHPLNLGRNNGGRCGVMPGQPDSVQRGRLFMPRRRFPTAYWIFSLPEQCLGSSCFGLGGKPSVFCHLDRESTPTGPKSGLRQNALGQVAGNASRP